MTLDDVLSLGTRFPELQATLGLVAAASSAIGGLYGAYRIARRWWRPPPAPVDIVIEGIRRATQAESPQPDDKGIAYFTQLIAKRPDDADAFLDRGRLRVEEGELDLAVADISEALRIAPTAAGYLARGEVQLARGDNDSAVSDFEKALDLDSKNAAALVLLANA